MRKLNLLFICLLLCNLSFSQSNPFETIGKEAPKTLTLSDGKYEEFFDNDSLRQVGSVIVNILREKIVGYVDIGSSQESFHPYSSSRFLSMDPIARQYPELTPYQFASNTPIAGVELDGLEMTFYSNVPNKAPTVIDEATIRVQVVSNGFPTSFDVNYKLSNVGVSESFIQHKGEWLRLPKGFTGNNLPQDEKFYENLQNFAAFNEEYKAKVNDLLDNVQLVSNVGKILATGLAAPNPYFKQSKSELLKSKRSMEKKIEEHKQKLEDFKKDPLGKTSPEMMKQMTKDNPSKEELMKRVMGRTKELEKQIGKQEGELHKINEAINQAQ